MGRIIALMVLMLAPSLAAGQSDVYFRASLRSTGAQGFDETVTFECRGAPTCVGTFKTVVRFENCPNFVTLGGSFTATNLSLAQSGSFTGTVTLTPGRSGHQRNADGTCTGVFRAPSETHNYTATWNRSTGTGTGSITALDGEYPFTFTAETSAPPPVFQMTVRSQVDSQTASASADIQFRPQDVGTQGSVFVFAFAPSTIVSGAQAAKAVKAGSPKAGENCVLAQRNASGQLVALSAAQLQAAITGTLSAQGASVSILDNVPTPSVAGATFYVGYGASGASMLASGVFRNAVTIPGASGCPLLPYQTSLWWNPRESGWGLNLNQQGGTIFATLFTYDSARAPLWLVMSNGAMRADGASFTGDLFRTTGPAFNANPFTPIGPSNVTRVGTMSLAFSDASVGTLEYTVNGVTVTKSIQRQVYGSRAATCLPTTDARGALANYQDLWWNPAESGWGLNVTHQDNTLFATLFTYDASGRALWLVMPGGTRQADGSYLGDLFRTSGSAFDAVPFVPLAPADVTQIGTMRLRFADGNNGTLTYTFNGTQVVKSITRQVFSTPLSLCN